MITLSEIGDKATDLAQSCKSTILREKCQPDMHSDSDEGNLKTTKKSASKDPTFGSDATIKTFYEGKDSSSNYFNWVDTPPRQISKKAARANDRVAIKVFKIKDLEKPVMNGKFALRYHMIEIQSPLLVEALKDIMLKENVHLEPTEVATFKHPFQPLWFRYNDISELHRRATEANGLKQRVGLLLKIMSDIFGNVEVSLKNMQASGLISFKYAWMYFPKDTLVYSPDDDCERICKVVDREILADRKGKKFLFITADEIVFNGDVFAWKIRQLQIAAFEGNRPITDLDHYPLQFSEDIGAIKARLRARGKKALQYQDLNYCQYEGLGIYNNLTSNVEHEKHNVSGRILIDLYGYQKHHLALQRRGDSETDTKKATQGRAPLVEVARLLNSILPTSAGAPTVSETPNKDNAFYIKRLTDEEQQQNTEEMLARPEDLMFLSPMLHGYALKNKLWLDFYVDDIKPITWNDTAYDHLVYPEEQKDLVLSFVENHKRTNTIVDDVIMGKGQGLILLLSGPPGTGKTLTAEAVADKTRRPLYYLQAEDLGINAAVLGANIKKVFEMATEWDAVILLDEADVFMAERNPNDIARNELVSIFLRELEYFRGIIFLTTNLYDTIDTAFRSRVNIHLLFNPLPPKSREVLWRKFIERLPPAQPMALESGEHEDGDTEIPSPTPLQELEDEDFKELSKWELNGREIKNAIKTVKSWCNVKGYKMNLMRLESGIKVTAPGSRKREFADEGGLYD